MVKHVVSFKLKGTQIERRSASIRFCEALMALPQKIECLLDMQAGVNDNPAEDWDVTLIATLDNMDDVAVYAAHPDHVAAAAIIAPLKEQRACVDFFID